MAQPVLTPALTRLRSGFTVAYPRRSTASDGWIGDLAHQGGTSGHNPDDTPGVSAERSDADNIPEVRAIDVDVDLIPGDRAASRLAMLREIRRIIATPRDRRRLIYIIFDGLIWSASRGWEPATYTGENKHREHAHFSGHPDYDNDGSAWSVETGETVEPAELAELLNKTTIGSPALGTFSVADLLKKSENARREAIAAKDNAAASKAEAELAKDLAGQAGLAVEALRTELEGRDETILTHLTTLHEAVTALASRPPVEIDYRELAGNLLAVVRDEGSTT